MRNTMPIAFLCLIYISAKAQVHQTQDLKMQRGDQAMQTAIRDFSKTKLFKRDSVFIVTLYDTLYHVAVDTISENHFASKRGQPYPNIIAVDILGFPYKHFLDTTVDLSHQKGIPQRFIEQKRKIFFGTINNTN